MSETISNPVLVLKGGNPVPSIEIDNDAIEGAYEGGAWEELVPTLTAHWVKRKKYAKNATIWMWGTQSINFLHDGYSIFIAQFGLPMSYLEALRAHLHSELPGHVRFSDYVTPNLRDGWRGRVHVQDQAVWTPLDACEWTKVTV